MPVVVGGEQVAVDVVADDPHVDPKPLPMLSAMIGGMLSRKFFGADQLIGSSGSLEVE